MYTYLYEYPQTSNQGISYKAKYIECLLLRKEPFDPSKHIPSNSSEPGTAGYIIKYEDPITGTKVRHWVPATKIKNM